LVEIVDLAVADLEVAPERAAKPARLGSVGRPRPPHCLAEGQALRRRQRPLTHLGVRARWQVDPADGRMRVEPVARAHGGQPAGVGLDRLEEPLDPAALAPALLPGRRPGAELLAVVAHGPDAVTRLRRVLAEVRDDLVDLVERDPVAQALLCSEYGQQPALVLGRVRP